MNTLELNGITPQGQSLLNEFPSRGMCILKMEFDYNRLLLPATVKKLADLPDLKNGKVGASGTISYKIVACWSDDTQFPLGAKVLLDPNGLIVDYNSNLTEALFAEVIEPLSEMATQLRKVGKDVNKELPSTVTLTTYVLTETCNIKATASQNLADLRSDVENLKSL